MREKFFEVETTYVNIAYTQEIDWPMIMIRAETFDSTRRVKQKQKCKKTD